jgi:hypothetical protein
MSRFHCGYRAFLIVPLAIILTGCGAPPVTLSLKLESGKTYKAHVVQEQNMKMTMMGKDMDMKNNEDMTLSSAVESVDPSGSAKVKLTFDNVSISTSMGGNAMPMNPGKALQGQSVGMTVMADGQVGNISGTGAIADKALAELAGMMPGLPQSNMKDMVTKQFDQLAKQSGLLGTLPLYPPKPVRVGDTWTAQVDRGGTQLNANCTLKARNAGVATIEFSGALNAGTEALGIPSGMPGMGSLKVNLTGQMNGSMDMDESSGLARKSTLSGNASGNIEMAMPTGGQGMSMPVSITISQTTEAIQ